ncbi:MAG: peptidase M15 [Bacteroidaceae bacterium]|nr:peptidase M15 [Bacteroidaceae bacterium]
MTTPSNTLPLPSKGEVGRGLTPHFTLAEFTRSSTAKRHGLDNCPSDEVIQNLRLLCENILEPLRQHLGCPVTITSGYRQPHVNILVGGVRHSQHTLGQAADIRVPRDLMPRTYMYIRDHLPYDQLIMEPGWIHVSYRHGHNRHQEVIIAPNDV